jgi:hypothetical protein
MLLILGELFEHYFFISIYFFTEVGLRRCWNLLVILIFFLGKLHRWSLWYAIIIFHSLWFKKFMRDPCGMQ